MKRVEEVFNPEHKSLLGKTIKAHTSYLVIDESGEESYSCSTKENAEAMAAAINKDDSAGNKNRAHEIAAWDKINPQAVN